MQGCWASQRKRTGWEGRISSAGEGRAGEAQPGGNARAVLRVLPLPPHCPAVSHLGCTSEVIVINLLNGLEIDEAFQLRLMLVCRGERKRETAAPRPRAERSSKAGGTAVVGMGSLTHVVGEGVPQAVKDKPALLPGPDFASHLDQVAFAQLLREDDVAAGVHAVAGGFDVQAQVKVLFTDRQVTGQGASLQNRGAVERAAGAKVLLPPSKHCGQEERSPIPSSVLASQTAERSLPRSLPPPWSGVRHDRPVLPGQ